MRSSRTRHYLSLVLALSVAISFLSMTPDPTRAAPLDWDVPNGHYFTQTNGQPQGSSQAGFTVTNSDGALFWTEFNQVGGLQVVGYPMSRRFLWDGFVTQVFQKAVFQWKPADGRVDFVNTFDQMSLAGKDGWLASSKSTPKPLDAAAFDAGKSWDQIVAARQRLLDAAPAIKTVYYSVPDPIRMFGLPTSAIVDNGNHYAIRLQRAVLQQWKEAVPWAAAGQVTVGNGGDIAAQAGMFSGDILKPQASPSDPAVASPPVPPAVTPVPIQPPTSVPSIAPAPNPQGSTGVYLVTVTRKGKDWYRESQGAYFRTRYCYEYVYGASAVYDSRRGQIYFQSGVGCDVVEVITGYMEAQIAGEFTGWSGNTVFLLTNGQVWQQASYAYTYHYAYRPEVLIYESPVGYKMKVQDVDEILPVRPIR